LPQRILGASVLRFKIDWILSNNQDLDDQKEINLQLFLIR